MRTPGRAGRRQPCLGLPIVPVGGGGFLAAFFTGFLAVFLAAFLAVFLVGMNDDSVCERLAQAGYHDILNRLQYQLSSRTRRASSFLRRSAMSLAASMASAAPNSG